MTSVGVRLDASVNDPPVVWAVELLTERLRGLDGAPPIVVVAAGAGAPESVRLRRPDGTDGPVVVTGGDARGLMYGVLELADRVAHSDDPIATLRATEPIDERPATPVRSICRVFVSDVQDTPWFHDRAFWSDYLTELATDRINRFHLGFGMQYNYGHHPATDNYLCFPYPFLLDVPGYDVRVQGVSVEERQRNLDTLRYITDETKRHGIHFQLGLWNHAYDQGPGASYPVVGLSTDTHAPYCAAALTRLLAECPAIDGLTIRVHYEGGVPEPGHDFWRTVFTGVAGVADRRIEIDMHAKGVDEGLLDVARGTGQPVVVSAKHWAEHQGLPYQQTTIRDQERATRDAGSGLMAITAHQRRFTRYGYGDFLREGRDFGLLFRIWPGTQRVLLWGDPELAAGYGRLGTIGGALGIDLCEPLFFNGRKGSGSVDGRDPYRDPALRLGGQEWRKYRYTYRLWGRLLYNPHADPEVWRRFLSAEYGAAALAVERALAAASKVLPLVTVAHALGASNNGYWPEMYTDMPIVEGPHSEHHAGDAGARTFGGVSSFDPSMFARVDEYADDVVAGRRDGRYGADEVAEWLESLADTASDALATARDAVADPRAPEFQRLAIDVVVQAELGRFFAGKFRAALGFALYERSKSRPLLVDAVDAYRTARAAWTRIVAITEPAYREMAFGDLLTERGHWTDRLAAIDADITAMQRLLDTAPDSTAEIPHPERADRPALEHSPAPAYRRGEDIEIAVTTGDVEVVLHYRHLNQGEDYRTVTMTRTGSRHVATIPGDYTDAPYPLCYYFVTRAPSGDAWIVPGLDSSLATQPYYVIRRG